MEPEAPNPAAHSREAGRWLARSGRLVFLFFLLKGLGWLVLGALAGFGLAECSDPS